MRLKHDPWGCVHAADNDKMDRLAMRLQKQMNMRHSTKATKEARVREFMRAYLSVGTDPTETVRRDSAWTFLQGATQRVLTEEELDAVWSEEVQRKGSWACSVQ